MAKAINMRAPVLRTKPKPKVKIKLKIDTGLPDRKMHHKGDIVETDSAIAAMLIKNGHADHIATKGAAKN